MTSHIIRRSNDFSISRRWEGRAGPSNTVTSGSSKVSHLGAQTYQHLLSGALLAWEKPSNCVPVVRSDNPESARSELENMGGSWLTAALPQANKVPLAAPSACTWRWPSGSGPPERSDGACQGLDTGAGGRPPVAGVRGATAMRTCSVASGLPASTILCLGVTRCYTMSAAA